MSLRTKFDHKLHAIEALRRCKMKYPGQQKIIISNRHGFTKLTHEEYQTRREEGSISVDGKFLLFACFMDYANMQNIFSCVIFGLLG